MVPRADSDHAAMPESITTVGSTIPAMDSTKAGEESDGGPGIPELHSPERLTMLPGVVRDTLVARGCLVPQYVGDYERNVFRGSLFAPSDSGWAIWCKLGTDSRILVFRDNVLAPAGELETQAAELPEPGQKPGADGRYCVGSVGVVMAKYLVENVRSGLLAGGGADTLTAGEKITVVHDGIVDGDCEGVSNVHYWTGKRWVIMPGGD